MVTALVTRALRLYKFNSYVTDGAGRFFEQLLVKHGHEQGHHEMHLEVIRELQE